jgi:hypothetical protein
VTEFVRKKGKRGQRTVTDLFSFGRHWSPWRGLGLEHIIPSVTDDCLSFPSTHGALIIILSYPAHELQLLLI